MPFVEYILLAFLGSAPATIAGRASSGTASTRIITADAVSQPGGGTAGDLNAGVALVGQAGGGSTDSKRPTTGKKPLEHTRSRRHHRRGHAHQGGAATSGKKATKTLE